MTEDMSEEEKKRNTEIWGPLSKETFKATTESVIEAHEKGLPHFMLGTAPFPAPETEGAEKTGGKNLNNPPAVRRWLRQIFLQQV